MSVNMVDFIESAVQKNFEKNIELYLEVKKNKDEVFFWLNFLRLFSVSLLAGSIWGIYSLNSYVDSIVNERIQMLDNLPIAISYAETGDWHRSIMLLDGVWNDLIENKIVDNQEFKDQFLRNYLWALASENLNDESLTNDLSLKWKSLKGHSDFIRLKNISKNDEAISRYVVICDLKFDFEKVHMSRYVKVLKSLKAQASDNNNKLYEADLSYQLAMMHIILGKESEAIEYVIQSHLLHPSEYHIKDWDKYKSSYFNDPGYSLYRGLSLKYDIEDFEALHDALVYKANIALEKKNSST